MYLLGNEALNESTEVSCKVYLTEDIPALSVEMNESDIQYECEIAKDVTGQEKCENR